MPQNGGGEGDEKGMSSNELAAERVSKGRYDVTQLDVAVLLPCYNEEHAIAKVVADFRAALPGATVYVYDNNSTDGTVAAATQAGAVVRRESHQGKGHVVRRMFNDIEADVYVLVDGDATYDAPSAPAMVDKLIAERLDMVVATRIDREAAAYRPGHRTGNRLLSGFVAHIFGRAFTDILSGYRVFSRRFVKSFPILSGGFEIETELTVHALELELPVGEMATPYYSRPAGSISKLSTWQDGFRILWTVLQLYRAERPLSLFGAFGIALIIMSDRPRHPDRHHLRTGRHRAAAADGGAVDRIDAARFPVDRLRPDPRHRHARPARGQADRLSGAARAGRGAAADLKTLGAENCANSSAPTMPC